MPDTNIKIITEYGTKGEAAAKRSLSDMEQGTKKVEKASNEASAAVERFKQSISGVSDSNYKKLSAAAVKLQNDLSKITGRAKVENAMKNIDSGNLADVSKAAKTLTDEYGKAASSVSNGNNKIGQSLANLRNAAQSVDYPFKSLVKSFHRIIKLRILRGTVRAVTGAFKEGIGNIYQYSAALNNMDASHVSGNLNNFATQLLYLKNSIGSAVAPLVSVLIPVIAQVANWFATAASYVAQFFAVLGGQSTYTKAKEQATTWGNVAAGAGSAAAAAKEYQNTILGFDEIHALNDPSSGGGGGGGGGGAAPDYSSMFEEAPIDDNWLTRFAKNLRDNWDDVLEIVKAIGAALLAWKIASAVTDFFDKLGIDASGAMKFAAGITIAIVGFKLEWDAAYEAGYTGNFDTWTIIKEAVGASLGVGGLALASSALGAGALPGLVLGVGLAIAIHFQGIRMGEWNREFDETIGKTNAFTSLDRVIDHSSSVIGTFSEKADKVVEDLKKLKDGTSDYGKMAETAFAESLIGRIKELASQTNRTASETNELKTKIKMVNDMNLDGVKIEYDELTGKVTANWKEIDKTIAKMKEQARTAAEYEVLKDAYKSLFELEAEGTRLAHEYRHADLKLQEAEANVGRELAKNAGMRDNTNKQLVFYDKVAAKAKEATESSKAALDENRASVNKIKTSIEVLTTTMGKNKESVDKSTEANKANKTAADNAATANRNFANTKIDTTANVKQINNAKTAADDGKNSIAKMQTAVQNFQKEKLDTKSKVTQIGNATTAAGNASGSIDNMKKSMKNVNEYKMNLAAQKSQIDTVKTSADGAKTSVNNTKTAVSRLSSAKPNNSKIIEFLKVIGLWADDTKRKISLTKDALDTLANTNATVNTRVTGNVQGGRYTMADGGFLPGYASGGMNIKSASMFYAHENGAPELVGRIGTHTAVANTSQMVDAMAQGVYRAMSEIMSDSSGNTEVNVWIDGDRVANAVDRANKQKNRRFNVQMA